MDKKEMKVMLDTLVTDAHVNNKCDVTASMLKRAFGSIATTHPDVASDILESFDGALHYNNFVTETEARKITNKMFNAGGASRWKDANTLFEKVRGKGGDIDNKPAYNKWALYATMVMLHGDHDAVFDKYSEGDEEKYFDVCYDFAVSKLHNTDPAKWIRPNLGL